MNNRVKFYGMNDMAIGFQAEAAFKFLDKFGDEGNIRDVNEAIELHNSIQFIENKLYPKSFTAEKIGRYQSTFKGNKKKISIFFNSLNKSNCKNIISGTEGIYHNDLLVLLHTYRVDERIEPSLLLKTLVNANFSLSQISGSKELIKVFDIDIRNLMLADPKSAEIVMRKYLEVDGRTEVFIPSSLTNDDMKKLLSDYIDYPEANPNYIKLIADASSKVECMNAKLKLKAKRKDKEWTNEFFAKSGASLKYGTDIAIEHEQVEKVVLSTNSEGIIRLSYGEKWLEEHSSNLEVINNFINLFGFVHDGMILSLPSYESELTGIFERFMGVKGKQSYPSGIAFNLSEQRAFGQVLVYERFLQARENSLEQVIGWFFNEYLKESYEANGFKYKPSSVSTYLERSRHVLTEMESVIKQFQLFVEEGEIDNELLDITSEQIRYHHIPSLVPDKYVCAAGSSDLEFIQYHLFSDQSSLSYIDDETKSDTLFELLLTNNVKYDLYQDYNRPVIDELIKHGVLVKRSGFIKFRSTAQIAGLKMIYDYEALCYYTASKEIRDELDTMIKYGWLTRESSLLTKPEASYFNFQLNQVEFSDGYDLRNKYLHGSQADKDDEATHYNVYIMVIKLMMALVIKIANDFHIKFTVLDSEKV